MPDFSFEIEALEVCAGQNPARPQIQQNPHQSGLFSNNDLPQHHLVVGLDEAGCGPWAGPVVAGAVVFPDINTTPQDLLDLLDDSKKLTEKRRDTAYNLLRSYEGKHCYIGSGQTSEAEIDDINIRQGALLAMKRAFDSLPVAPQFALIDGICTPNLPCPSQTLKKGDSRSFSIAAASIIAKVTRDRLMKKLATQYPEYLWERNAGYGTKAHQEALAQYGVTPHHRRSFAPIARLLDDQKEAA